LRFVAAFMALLHHLHDFAPNAVYGGWAARGALAVDFFFVLSGFILAHVHGDEFRDGPAGAGRFWRARLARVYPAHVATLAIFLILLLAAKASGAPINDERYGWGALVSHLTLLNAWSGQTLLSWNYPAWSISAEWAAYLAFPALAFALARLGRSGAVAALFALVTIFLIFAPIHAWTLRTIDGAEWRIFPEFLMGMLARRIWEPRPDPWAGTAAIALAAGIAAAGAAGVPDAPIVAAFVGLIVLSARLTGTLGRAFAHPIFVRLGEQSYSLYLVHALVFGLVFKAAAPLEKLGVGAGWLALGAIGLCMASAAALHRFVETPGRRWILTLGKPASYLKFSINTLK
jgi:peptidoglycan/LPS O-acetylase OafA/YrhL